MPKNSLPLHLCDLPMEKQPTDLSLNVGCHIKDLIIGERREATLQLKLAVV